MSNNKIEFYEQSLEENKKKEPFSDLKIYMNDENLCYVSTNKLYDIQNKNDMITKNKETYNNMNVIYNKNEERIKDESIHFNDHVNNGVDTDFFYNECRNRTYNNIHNNNNDEKNNSFYNRFNCKSDINKDNGVSVSPYSNNIYMKNEDYKDDEEEDKNESTTNSIDKILRNIQDDILFKSNDSKTLEHSFKYNLFEEYNYPHTHREKEEKMYEPKEDINKKKKKNDTNQFIYNNEYTHDENMYKAYIWYDKKKYLFFWNKNINAEDMKENLLTFCKKLTREHFYLVLIEKISYEYNNSYLQIYEDDNLKNKNLDIDNIEQEKDSILSCQGNHNIITLPYDDKKIMYYKKIGDHIYNYNCFDKIKNEKEYLIINHKINDIKKNETIKENNILENKILDDKILDDKIFGDKILDDKILDDKILDDKILDDKILDDKTLDDKILDDKTLDDKILDDNKLEEPLKFAEVLRAIEYTKEGCNLLKLTVFNIPHLRYFFVSKDLNYIKWYSSRKLDDQCKIYFNDINSLEINYKNNKLFEHYKIDILKKLSFCIVYNNEKKKIILTCKSFCEYHYWLTAIRALMFKSRKLKISRNILFSHLNDSFFISEQDDIINKKNSHKDINESDLNDRKHGEHINSIFHDNCSNNIVIVNKEQNICNNTSSCCYKNKDEENNVYTSYEQKIRTIYAYDKQNCEDTNMKQLKSFHLYKLISFPDYNIYQIKTKFYLLKEKFYKYKILIEQALDDFIIKTERGNTNKYNVMNIIQDTDEMVRRNISNGEYINVHRNNKQEQDNDYINENDHINIYRYNNRKSNKNKREEINKNIYEEDIFNHDYYNESNILNSSKLKEKKNKNKNKNNIHCPNEDHIVNIYDHINTSYPNEEDSDHFKLFLIIKIFNKISNKLKDIQKNIFHVVQLIDNEKLNQNKNQQTNLFSFDNLLKYSTDIYKVLQEKFSQHENKEIIGQQKDLCNLNNEQAHKEINMHNMKKLTKMKYINNNKRNNNNNNDNNNNNNNDNNNDDNNIYNATFDGNTKKDITNYNQQTLIYTDEHNNLLLSKGKKKEYGYKKKKLIHHILFQLWMCEVELGNIDDIYTVYINNIKKQNNSNNINNFLINLDTSKFINSISSQLSATILKYINL
ncbi:conserved Plasmodium protein, unknown function [Plasmodium sp. DRC-Itaito]|nr:conserved Plasmodium protein, unknown function [Plasmodium sp. DRC-Itaito]